MEHVRTVVVGGGQAGLSVSRELTRAAVEHVVLERGRVGETWRGRWDTFCLVTPNWSVQLPGHPYDGSDPDGFMPRDAIVAYLERFATAARVPVREGVVVEGLDPLPGGGFHVRTDAGPLRADSVVLATGTYRRPHRPPAAAEMPSDLLQLDVVDYSNAAALPTGRVLVVGSGQSGCQLAEELHVAGREVVLACGRAPWFPRRVAGRDLVWWLVESGFFDATAATLPTPAARLQSNFLTSGHGGGHDLHLRTLRALGVTLVGRFIGVSGRRARFAADLAANVAWGDERYTQLCGLLRKVADERGLELPDPAPPPPFDPAAPEEVDLAGFGAVLFAGGFRPDFRSSIPRAEAFDDLGFPIQREGTSSVVPGLHFVGVHFQRKRKSSLLCGVGEDAAIVARTVAAGA
ncbi:MAG TPA: NAD(P)-binding domain-containing protein [Candidatus Eisenbacteria bacterium]|nr:NAD(P)-binding domain-containing protein [Candidatus Eisenbacteria bacterium]